MKGIFISKKDYFFMGQHRVRAQNPFKERGVYQLSFLLIKPGMSVTIIAGGSGITSLVALKKLSSQGSLTIYEGGKESLIEIEKNIKANSFTNYTLIHGIVGDKINVYGGSQFNAEIILPTEITECDYLELDCEGGEKSILENMIIRPKYITVEIHPKNIGENSDWFFNWLKENQYKAEYYFGHDGYVLDEYSFKELYDYNLETGNKHLPHLLARAPMVVGLQKID